MMEIQNCIRQILYITAHKYLMQPIYQNNQNYGYNDDYLIPLQTNLSLKQAPKIKQEKAYKQNNYDNLFSQFSQPAQFNQLFDNSFNQNNQNFSQINEEGFDEDSLFNDDEGGGYFNERKLSQNKTMQIKRQEKSQHQSKDSNKILQILKMKDNKQKQGCQKMSKNFSNYESIEPTKNISKSLIIKPKLSTHRSSKSQIQPMVKLVKKRSDSTTNTSNRIKTESNQDLKYYKKAKQICKTQYDSEFDTNPKNNFPMILQEKDSFQCTFKPNLLQQCLKEIKNNPFNNNASQISSKSNQRPKTNKNSKDSKIIMQPIQLKKIQKDRISLQIHKQKVNLSKKSSAQASGATLDVVSRNQLWLIQKQQRLTQKRKQEEEQKLKRQDYSFKPNINQYKKETKISSKPIEKDSVPPFFQRLSMAKQKNTAIKFKKDISQNPKYIDCQIKDKNKENMFSFDNLQKDYSQAFKNKKQSYQLAVKELHYKIMKMNI